MVFTANIYKKLHLNLLDCNNNNKKDNGETGVDCGGGGCPACLGMYYSYIINNLFPPKTLQ